MHHHEESLILLNLSQTRPLANPSDYFLSGLFTKNHVIQLQHH